MIRDKKTNKTKGFGFVSFKEPGDFTKAMREMNGKYVGSRPIKVGSLKNTKKAHKINDFLLHLYIDTEHTLSITDEEIKLERQEHRSCQAEAETKAGDGFQVVKLGPVYRNTLPRNNSAKTMSEQCNLNI